MDFKTENLSIYLFLTLGIIWINTEFVLSVVETQCAGRNITLQCDSPDWLIQILYEEYGDVNQSESTCQMTSKHCLQNEFISPPSVTHCNGRTTCTFEVPTNVYLTSCSKNATAVRISYNCIPSQYDFNMCGDIYSRDTQALYLHTPEYPVANLNALNVTCTCHVTGQNITVTTMDQVKVQYSNVILILATSNGTKNINDMSLLNRAEFTGVDKVEVILDNDYNNETFKLWMSFHGTNLMLMCGSPVIPSIVSTSMYLSSTEIPLASSQPMTIYPTQTYADNSTLLLTSMGQSYSNTLTIKSTATYTSTVDQSSTSSFNQSDSSNNDNNTITNQRDATTDQSDWVLIVVLSVTFSVIFIVIFVIILVLVCRRKERDDLSYSTDDVNRSEPSTIYAFDNVETEENAVRF